MPGFIGLPEILLLGLVALLVFGPKRLPEMGRSFGGGLREFKRSIAGDDAPRRTGNRLAAGYMGVTLFWLHTNSALPPTGTACFLTDYFGALLTGTAPVTDPTCAASGWRFLASASIGTATATGHLFTLAGRRGRNSRM